MSKGSEAGRECDKLIHRIAMKFDPEYRLREMGSKEVTSATSFEDLRAIALSARARGEISSPGDARRAIFINTK